MRQQIRRAHGKDGDIGELLGAEHRPEPRGHRGAGHPCNVAVLLLPALHVRPGVEGNSTLLGWVLLDITVHALSSPLLWLPLSNHPAPESRLQEPPQRPELRHRLLPGYARAW